MKEISSGKRFLIAIAVVVVFFLFINVRQLLIILVIKEVWNLITTVHSNQRILRFKD